jgi:hypothetical protein
MHLYLSIHRVKLITTITTNPTKTTCCTNICKQSIREDIDHKALIDIRFMYRLHIMHPSNPMDEQRHYPIILHGLKHIGVMETPENVVDEDGGDEAWEHP